MQPDPTSKPFTGLLIAMVIGILWLSSLEFLLSIDIDPLIPLWIVPAILGRTFIQTGLFIVAHDAIHEAVLPNVDRASPLKNRQWNHCIGRVAVTLYALLSYEKISRNHWQHHQHPGQESDPDFHDGIHRNFFAWYLKFMKSYLDIRQGVVLLLGIGIIFLIFHLGFHVPSANLFLFWLLPIVLSSMQLFFFGTYLPHRSYRLDSTASDSDNTENSDRATSSYYPIVWSFLTCYHFGYHWEHHEYPFLPWYRLPSVRKKKRQRHSSKIAELLRSY